MAPSRGLVVLGAEGPSIAERLSLILGATGASKPSVVGDRWCKVEAGDVFWAGDAAGTDFVAKDAIVGPEGLAAFSVEDAGWRERAIRPRFRRSRVNSQWT